MAAEGDIRLQAAQNTASLSGNSSSSSGSIGVSVGAQTGITVSASKGRGNQAGDDLTHTNTHIAAGNSVTLHSGGEPTLWAVVSGKLRSVGILTEDGVSAGKSRIDSNYQSVTEQDDKSAAPTHGNQVVSRAKNKVI